MSIALSEFWTRIVRLGLADPDRCRAWAHAYSEANAGTLPSDSVAIAKFLITRNVLTKFQAKALLSDDYRKLRLGNFVQRSSETPPPPLSHWHEFEQVGKSATNELQRGYLLRLKNDPTAASISQSLRQQAVVQSPRIQSVQVTNANNRPVLVFSPLAPGRCLHQVLGQSTPPARHEVATLAVQLAEAVAAFHHQGFIHGQVQADRVWLSDDGQVTLLRAMTTRPATAGGWDAATAAAVASLLWLDGDDFNEYYLAPEAAKLRVSPASDVYSLGCLLFRLATGRRPFEGSDVVSIRAAHESEMPHELVESVAKGEAGDPLMRILAFAIAKNPQARFQDAAQMQRALEAIATTYKPTTPVATKSAAEEIKPAPAAIKPAPAAIKPVPTAIKPAPTAIKPAPAAVEATKPDVAKPQATPPTVAGAKSPVEKKPAVAPAPVTAKREVPRVAKSAPEPQPAPSAPEPQPAPSAPEPQPAPSAPQATPLKPTEPVVASPAEPPAATATPTPTSPAPTAPTPAAPTPTAPTPVAPTPAAPVRRRRKKKSKAPVVLGGLGIGVLVLMISLLAGVGTREEEAPRRPRPTLRVPPTTTTDATSTSKPSATDSPSTANGFELVASDRLLWVPPHAKETAPPSLSLLPPGPGAIVSVRLNQVQNAGTGQTLLRAFSPELTGLIEQAAQRSKVSVDEISRCTIAMHPGRDGWPQVSLAIELTAPRPLSELIQSWGVSAAMTTDGETIYAGDEPGQDAYYVLPSDNATGGTTDANVQRFAVGSLEQIQQVASIQGSTIVLPPILAGLWKSASETSTLTAMFNSNFLFTDARQLFAAAAPQLFDPLRRMWIPNVGAVMLAAELDDDRVYVETRMAPSGNVAAPALLNSVRESIQELPSWGENFIVNAVPDASWRLLANRLPMMLRFTVEQTRFGVEDGNAVLNAYLPAAGFSQLTIASLLAMNTSAGSAPMAASTKSSEVLTVDQMLDREMSISFDQESLESAFAAVVAEFKRVLPPGNEPPVVRILGGDLQKMGITQNQPIRDFQKKGVALRTVLTDITLAANTDRTATSSHDPKQALIWVVADDPENPGKRVILVTTRDAASGKYELPTEFQPQ